MQRRILTKEKMAPLNFWVRRRDMDRVISICRAQGVSRSEFLRLALQERIDRIMAETRSEMESLGDQAVQQQEMHG
jgi:hypothetical protein